MTQFQLCNTKLQAPDSNDVNDDDNNHDDDDDDDDDDDYALT